MPRYKFVGEFETVLHDLQHGVNAELHRKDHGQPAESTVVAQPGDEITTAKAYAHALMEKLETTARKAAPRKAPAKKAAPSTDSSTPAASTEGQE
jgi:hypothetical protein